MVIERYYKDFIDEDTKSFIINGYYMAKRHGTCLRDSFDTEANPDGFDHIRRSPHQGTLEGDSEDEHFPELLPVGTMELTNGYRDSWGVTYSASSTNLSLVNSPISLGKYVIPKRFVKGSTEYSITSISANAFQNDTNLTEVIIEATTISSIGSNAFQNIGVPAYIYVPNSDIATLVQNSGIDSTTTILIRS